MIKVFCDSCQQEITQIKRHLDVPFHLTKSQRNSFDGYEDQEGNRISGKTEYVDLCLKCHNLFYEKWLESINL